jgi:hypothetical protein
LCSVSVALTVLFCCFIRNVLFLRFSKGAQMTLCNFLFLLFICGACKTGVCVQRGVRGSTRWCGVLLWCKRKRGRAKSAAWYTHTHTNRKAAFGALSFRHARKWQGMPHAFRFLDAVFTAIIIPVFASFVSNRGKGRNSIYSVFQWRVKGKEGNSGREDEVKKEKKP